MAAQDKRVRANKILRKSTAVSVSVALIAILITLPYILPAYGTALLISIFYAVILAISFNLIAGYAGLFSLGHNLGLGSSVYAFIFLINMGIHVLLSGFIAFFFTVALAAFVGAILIRVRGAFFAILTLAVCQIAMAIANNTYELGRAFGLYLPTTMVWSTQSSYYAMLLLMLVTYYLSYKVVNSRFGLALHAIRESEEAASAIGVDLFKTKLLIFIISSVPINILGILHAFYYGFTIPIVFGLFIALQMQFSAIVGGLGTLLGPIIGSVILTLSSNLLGLYFPGVSWMFYGVVILVVMTLLPQGIWGYVSTRVKK